MEDIIQKPRKWKERWFSKEKTIQADAPSEEKPTPDTPTPDTGENEANKLMENKDYFSLIQLVLKNNLPNFDIKELASHLAYGKLFYIVENYNIPLSELVSDDMLEKLKEDLKNVGGLLEERKSKSYDFYKSDIFQKLMSANQELDELMDLIVNKMKI